MTTFISVDQEFNFESDNEDHINGDNLSCLSDEFGDTPTNGGAETFASNVLSMDDVSFSRDPRLVNVPTARPKTIVVTKSGKQSSRDKKAVRDVAAAPGHESITARPRTVLSRPVEIVKKALRRADLKPESKAEEEVKQPKSSKRGGQRGNERGVKPSEVVAVAVAPSLADTFAVQEVPQIAPTMRTDAAEEQVEAAQSNYYDYVAGYGDDYGYGTTFYHQPYEQGERHHRNAGPNGGRGKHGRSRRNIANTADQYAAEYDYGYYQDQQQYYFGGQEVDPSYYYEQNGDYSPAPDYRFAAQSGGRGGDERGNSRNQSGRGQRGRGHRGNNRAAALPVAEGLPDPAPVTAGPSTSHQADLGNLNPQATVFVPSFLR